MAWCSTRVVHWLTVWGWTYDPREPDTVIPFEPFPKQAEFLTWLREREATRDNGVVEKSRDMGVTWLCVAYATHGWLFRDGFAVGFGSRKLDLVDKRGDPDSIFEKIRFLLRHLPEWMMPPGFDWREHDNQGRLVNPANGATITGEGGDQIGRGGRKSLYFVDEAAFLDYPDRIERSLSQTTHCRIDVSTPNGPGNPWKAFASRRRVCGPQWSCRCPKVGGSWRGWTSRRRGRRTACSPPAAARWSGRWWCGGRRTRRRRPGGRETRGRGPGRRWCATTLPGWGRA
jgi:phage terminase large subunit